MQTLENIHVLPCVSSYCLFVVNVFSLIISGDLNNRRKIVSLDNNFSGINQIILDIVKTDSFLIFSMMVTV